MKWNLRLAAANRGIWKASELQRLLAERGMVISAGKMSGLGLSRNKVSVPAAIKPVALNSPASDQGDDRPAASRRRTR